MGLFGKKSAAQKNGEDRELIERNATAVSALIVLAQDNAELVQELEALREKLKYLIPSKEKQVFEKDKKISDVLGDLRIELSKRDGKTTDKVNDFVTEVKLILAERTAL